MAPEAHRGDGSGWFFVGLAVLGVAYIGTMAGITSDLGAVAIPIWGATLLGLIFLANSPIGKAVARRISGGEFEPPPPVEVPDEVYGELDELRARMLEMEERQDFAERLLAERPDADGADAGGAR
jgi:hypothetical protein